MEHDRKGCVSCTRAVTAARTWSVRVSDAHGSGTLAGLIAGLDWVAQRPQIVVVNLSLGAPGDRLALDEVLSTLTSRGVVALAAPGTWLHSTLPGVDTAEWSETSTAAPFVAGAGARYISAHELPALTGARWAQPRVGGGAVLGRWLPAR